MDLQLRPGEILMVQSLAKELGLSRTPVREALVRLAQEGLVVETEGKKFKVAELTLVNAMEIHEIRQVMEKHAARKVALNRTDAQLNSLKTLAGRIEAALSRNDYHGFYANDLEFHDRILRFSGNQTLVDMMSGLGEKIQRLRHLTSFAAWRLEETIQEHADILAAIEAQSPVDAEMAMEAHLGRVGQTTKMVFSTPGLELLGHVYFGHSPDNMSEGKG